MFSIQVINSRTKTFRIWNYGEVKQIISLNQILLNVQFRWELKN